MELYDKIELTLRMAGDLTKAAGYAILVRGNQGVATHLSCFDTVSGARVEHNEQLFKAALFQLYNFYCSLHTCLLSFRNHQA
jgi:hypothetical protein